MCGRSLMWISVNVTFLSLIKAIHLSPSASSMSLSTRCDFLLFLLSLYKMFTGLVSPYYSRNIRGGAHFRPR